MAITPFLFQKHLFGTASFAYPVCIALHCIYLLEATYLCEHSIRLWSGQTSSACFVPFPFCLIVSPVLKPGERSAFQSYLGFKWVMKALSFKRVHPGDFCGTSLSLNRAGEIRSHKAQNELNCLICNKGPYSTSCRY